MGSEMAGEPRDPPPLDRAGDWWVWIVDKVVGPILVVVVLVGVGGAIVRRAPGWWRGWTDPLVGSWRAPDNQDNGIEFKSDGTVLFPWMNGFPGAKVPDDPGALSDYLNLRAEYTKEQKSVVIRTDYRNTKNYREQGVPLVAKDGIKIEVVPYMLDGDVLTFGGSTLVRRR
jgi:hypothetical protein